MSALETKIAPQRCRSPLNSGLQTCRPPPSRQRLKNCIRGIFVELESFGFVSRLRFASEWEHAMSYLHGDTSLQGKTVLPVSAPLRDRQQSLRQPGGRLAWGSTLPVGKPINLALFLLARFPVDQDPHLILSTLEHGALTSIISAVPLAGHTNPMQVIVSAQSRSRRLL